MTRIAAEKENMVLRLTRIWLWVMLTGLPLAVYHGFFDITEVKTAWFVVGTVLYLTGRLVCLIQFGGGPRTLTAAGLCAVCFCFIALLASLSSGFFLRSVYGSEGRWQGMGMFWLYAALWAALRDVPLRREDVLRPLAAGLALGAAFTITNHLGLDPLRMEAPLGPFDRGRYIGTLGNINFAGAYFSLTLPPAAWALLSTERRRERAVWGAVFALGLWAAMAVRSECALLGVGTGLAVLPMTLPDRRSLRRFGLLLPGVVILMHCYRLAAAMCGAELSALTRWLLGPIPGGLLFLTGAAVFLASQGSASCVKLKRGWAMGLLLLLVSAAAALLLLNTIGSSIPLGPWESWLRFTDEWGTDRVKVWKHVLRLRRSFGLWETLLGGGCGILARMDALDRVFPDAVLDAAHCEYLQIRINWGVLGLLAYLGWLVLSVREGLRRGGESACPLLPGLAAYAVQAAVNIAQAPGIPLFFILLAAQRAKSPEKDGSSGKMSVDKDGFCGKILKAVTKKSHVPPGPQREGRAENP